jgi:hypothetical protein
MDSLITAAARALAAGDPLGALKRVALRDDAPALALRGLAMAQLGELVRAKALLRGAARAFGPREAVARARCVVAEAEIALVSRDLGWPAKALEAARATLEEHGDRVNAAHAGTAFDGQHLFQLAEDRIQKIDPKTGHVLATIPAPGGGGDSGLTWAEGTLWVGQYRDRKIHQIDPQTGTILRTIESNRFVTGVTWVDGELWHATWEGDESDLRRVDPRTGEVLERLEMPPGVMVSGLESDGGDQFFCGGGRSGKVRTVRRPKRGSATGSGAEIPVGSTSK